MNRLFFLDNETVIQKIKSKENDIFIVDKFPKKPNKHIHHLHSFSKGFKYNKEFYNPYWLQEWAKTSIHKNKNIKELLIYKNQTLWYFFEYLIYASIWGISNPSSGQIIYNIDLITKIIKEFKPKVILIQNNKDLIYKLIIDIAQKQNIRVKNLKQKPKPKQNKLFSLLNIPFVFRSYLNIRFLSRYFLGKLSRKLPKKDVLIISGQRFCKGNAEQNSYWGPIVKELNKYNISNKIIEYDGFWNIHSYQVMLERHLRNKHNTQYLGTYFKLSTITEAYRIHRLLKKQWNRFKNNNEFKNSLTYNNINIHKYLKPRFSMLFNSFSLFFAEILALTNNMLEKEQPKVLLMEHEQSYYGLGSIINTKINKKLKTKNIATEFEAVNTRTSVHRHIPSKTAKNKNSPLWRPLADVKCSSGEHAKNILTKYCNIPEKNIVITGHPKFDTLPNLKFNKLDIIKQLKLDPNKKIIVYGTKYREDEDIIFNKIIDFINSNNNLQLVFKIAPNVPLYNIKTRIKETDRIKIVQDFDVNKVLHIADLLITDRSQLGVEAILLDRDILIFDLYQTCTFPYTEKGAAFGTHKLEEIIPGIKTCLTNKTTKQQLKQGRIKYLKECFFKLDGKAPERVVNIIKTMSQSA